MMIPPAFSTGRTGRAPYQIAPDHRPRRLQIQSNCYHEERKGKKFHRGAAPSQKLRPGLGAAHCCAGCCTRGRPCTALHC
ncbi:hypothetical protein PVAP13_5KG747001 [Panicum virgatum]|uniref:Uncharacterized protein n=1 Tax=Panicum virgatum TaxID=38727 RepID=A0A8T0T1J3_PANVG|nr:hypothetical protein PVAP13_5KG747001 [Panicum virgatum]